uniref:Phospholipid-transporting ATPase n=1 Tax=Rhizophora mucronata TaxID=61149 RepID=A0A2P2IYK8_RHIMU
MLAYGAMSSTFSTNAYQILIEALAPAPSFWLITLVAVFSALVPYFSFSAIQMRFFPMYHQTLRWMQHEGRSEDPEYCNMVRQRSLRPTTVGFTARAAARTNSLNERNQNHSRF